MIPDLKGKLNGGAFRVPTPDGSVTDFTAVLEKDATVDSINEAFKKAAADKSFKGVLEYSEDPLVSQDIVGNPHSCIFDSKITLTLGNRFVKVVGWYDNEWGYSNRCVGMLELLSVKSRREQKPGFARPFFLTKLCPKIRQHPEMETNGDRCPRLSRN